MLDRSVIFLVELYDICQLTLYGKLITLELTFGKDILIIKKGVDNHGYEDYRGLHLLWCMFARMPH